MQWKYTDTYSHKYRLIYLKRLLVVSRVFSSILVLKFVLLDMCAWKYGKCRRVGAIYVVKEPPSCHICHPRKSAKLWAWHSWCTEHARLVLAPLPPGSSSTTSHHPVGRFLLHPSSSLWWVAGWKAGLRVCSSILSSGFSPVSTEHLDWKVVSDILWSAEWGFYCLARHRRMG